VIDLSEIVGRGVFAAWERPLVFEQAAITKEAAVEWPAELDMCPTETNAQKNPPPPR
jgi:hypothetical protein